MSSSQMLTPAAASWPRMSSCWSVMAIRSLFRCLAGGSVTWRLLPGSGGPNQASARGLHYPFRGQAELLVQDLVGGRGAEVLEAHRLARVADELPPAERHAGLDADPGPDRGRQHLLLVGGVLLGEPLDAGHGDHPGGRARLLQ